MSITVMQRLGKGRINRNSDEYYMNRSINNVKTKREVELRAALKEGHELVTDDSPANIRRIMEKAGNQMGSVHFIKRTNNELRKMSYRLHVKNPRYASIPSGKKVVDDVSHNQMTVFDCNKVVRENGVIIGRGAWRTVSLENVTRIVAGGTTYVFLPKY